MTAEPPRNKAEQAERARLFLSTTAPDHYSPEMTDDEAVVAMINLLVEHANVALSELSDGLRQTADLLENVKKSFSAMQQIVKLQLGD